MPIPVMFLKELTSARVVEELAELETLCEEGFSSEEPFDFLDDIRKRMRELRLAAEKFGIKA